MTADAAVTADRRPGRRRRWIPVVIVGGVLAVLIAGFFIADGILRGVAEQRVKSEVESRLPDNVDADVAVSIGGASVIAQYLTGSFEQVSLSAPDTTVDGIPVDLAVTASGVPVDTSKPVGEVHATVVLDEAAAQRVMKRAKLEGEITLGDGEVTYGSSVEILGVTLSYSFTVEPTASADRVTLMPTDVRVYWGSYTPGEQAGLDLGNAVDKLVRDDPPSLCVAQYLPEALELDSLSVTERTVTAKLSSTSLRLDGASLKTLGSCS